MSIEIENVKIKPIKYIEYTVNHADAYNFYIRKINERVDFQASPKIGIVAWGFHSQRDAENHLKKYYENKHEEK